jgi:chromosome segregation and condensation protein ScpB
MWKNADTIIASNKVGVSEAELKEFIKSCDSDNTEELYKELSRKQRGHSLVFERTTNGITKIRKEVLEFL